MFHIDPETSNRIVTLFKAANRSTFTHEIGHAFLEDLIMMGRGENASEQVKRDYETVREWLGMGEEQDRPTREQHEKFADGFLNYIETGQAPTKSLRGAFIRIKNWLRELFEIGEIQRIEISDEVRQVYDRLLATADETDAEYRARSSISDINAQIPAMEDDAKRTQRILDALDDSAALDDLIARLESGELGEQEADIEEIAASVADTVRNQVSDWDRLYQSQEINQTERENPKNRGNVISFIKSNGFIDYQKVKDRYGVTDAAQLRKKVGPGLFRKNGFGLDEFVALLESEGAVFESGDEIFELLMSDDNSDRALSEAYRKGVEEGKAKADRFLEVYDAWAAALKEQAETGAEAQSGEMLQAGFNAIETIMKLQAGAKEDSQKIAELSRQVQSLMSNLTRTREDAKANSEQADAERDMRSEKERELDILAEVADKLIGRSAKQEDKISALKALLADAKKEIRDDTKAIKAYGRFVDSLLGKNAKLADKNEWQKNMISALRVLLRHEESRHKMADSLADRLKNKLESLKAKQKLQRDAKKLLGQMARAAKNKQVAWERRQQIKEILSTVNTRDRNRKTDRKNSPIGEMVERKDGVRYRASDAERRAAIETLIEQYGETEGKEAALEEGFTKKDLALLKLSSMDAVSFEELKAVHTEIMDLQDIGRRELAERKAAEKEKVRLETAAQMEELRKGAAGRPPVILGAGAGRKRYTFADARQDAIRREQATGMAALEDEMMNGLDLSPEEYADRVRQIHSDAVNRIDGDFSGNIKRGLKRKLDYLTDRIITVIADRHRLFDLLDGGFARFDGAFSKFWVSGMNRCRDAMLRGIEARVGERLENKLRELGLSRIRLNEQVNVKSATARAFFGARFPTKAQVIGLFVLSKDPDARRSLEKGNFGGVPMSESLIDECVAALSAEEKALGNFIFDDFNDPGHFERAQRVSIAVLGEGMDKLDSYVSKFVVNRNPYIAEIDKDAAMKHADSKGRPEKIEPGFTKSRVKDSSPIETDIFKVWTRHVREEEHFIAFGEALKEARSLLFEPDPKNPNLTMAVAINEKYGNYVFRRVVEEYNRLAAPDILKANDAFDSIIGRFAASRAIAALAYNVSTYLKNFASLPKWFVEASPIDVMASLADYARDRKGFMDRVYAMDPQLAQRKGSYAQQLMSEGGEPRTYLEDAAKSLGGERAKAVASRGIELGMAPNAVIDRFMAAIMFDSAYRSGLRRNLTSEQARDEAQRTVQRLMQPSDASELSPMFSWGGLWRILLMFMSEAAKNTNVAAYDIPRQIADGNYSQALRGAFALALSAALIKMITEGVPALGGEDGGEEDESIDKWLFEAVMEGFVGQIPSLGTEIIDAIEGNQYRKDYAIVSDPFWKIWHGANKILQSEDDGDGEAGRLMRNGYTKKEWGTLSMAQGFAMLAGAPFTQAKRLYLSRDAQGVADMLLVNMGNRKALERARKNAKERNLANW
jgi:hypothetical protein